MYEKLAWNSFCKTGSLESFLEYKKIAGLKNQIKVEDIGEFSKAQGDSYKGSAV